jgi:hypothetical protein
MRHHRWTALRSIAILAISLAAAACSLFPGVFPNPSLSPRDLALRQLAANQALWQSLAIDDYVITIERQCFCPGGQYEITVVDGVVAGVKNDDGLPVRPAEVQGLPKTVPELFALVAAIPPQAALTVSWDVALGLPMLISVDPIPNAVDDEYSIVVHDFRRGS